MIEKIVIKNVATYGATPEEMTDLKKINFVYGSNGTGKTTITRVIGDRHPQSGCDVSWQNNTPIKTLVYNRDFIERNFNQENNIKGIFTLGEKDKDTIDKISVAKTELIEIEKESIQLQTTLNGKDGVVGKNDERKKFESDFEEKCWSAKLRHESNLKDAFTGFMGSKKEGS